MDCPFCGNVDLFDLSDLEDTGERIRLTFPNYGKFKHPANQIHFRFRKNPVPIKGFVYVDAKRFGPYWIANLDEQLTDKWKDSHVQVIGLCYDESPLPFDVHPEGAYFQEVWVRGYPNQTVFLFNACRITFADTGIVVLAHWWLSHGLQIVTHNFSFERLADLEAHKQAMELLRIILPKGGRTKNSGSITEANKWEAFNYVVERAREVFLSGYPFTKHRVALWCGNTRNPYGISAKNDSCDGNCHGCQAISRLIKKCNLEWTWKTNIADPIKNSQPS